MRAFCCCIKHIKHTRLQHQSCLMLLNNSWQREREKSYFFYYKRLKGKRTNGEKSHSGSRDKDVMKPSVPLPAGLYNAHVKRGHWVCVCVNSFLGCVVICVCVCRG